MFLLRRIISPAIWHFTPFLRVRSETLKPDISLRFSHNAQDYFWPQDELERREETEAWNIGDVGALGFDVCQVVFMFIAGSSAVKRRQVQTHTLSLRETMSSVSQGPRTNEC